MNITRETRLACLVGRYPAARVVLTRYGLDSYEEANPPRESIAQFAEDRGIPAKRLLEHHDLRKENILYPVLDRVTDEEERKELLQECFAE
jgi:hypothetical protein